LDVNATVDENLTLKPPPPWFFAKFRYNFSANFLSIVVSSSKGSGSSLACLHLSLACIVVIVHVMMVVIKLSSIQNSEK
jgi:hypothetical protein